MHCNVRNSKTSGQWTTASQIFKPPETVWLYTIVGYDYFGRQQPTAPCSPSPSFGGRHVGIRPFSHGHKQFGMKSPVQTRPKNAWNACFAWRHSMDSQDHTPKGSHTEATQRNVKQYEEMFHGSSYERNQWGSECNR